MAASSSPSRRPVRKLVVRLSTGAEKRRVRALSPYYETKTKALLEPAVAQIGRGGSEEYNGGQEYPDWGEDDDMDDSINTDEARDSLGRDSWILSGQQLVEFTGDCCSNGFLEHSYTASPRLDFDLCIDPRLRYDTSSSRVVTSVGKTGSAGPATIRASTSSMITSDNSTPWNSAIGSPKVALWGGQSSNSQAENEGLSTHNIDDMFTKLVDWKDRYVTSGNPTNSIGSPHFSPVLPAMNVNPHAETTDVMSTKLAEWKRRYLTSENSQQTTKPACFPSPSLPAQVDFVAQSVDMMSSRLAEWKSRYQTPDNPQKPTPLLTFPVPTLPVIPVDEIAESVQNMYSKLVNWKHRYLTPEIPQNLIRPPLPPPRSLPGQVREIPHAPDQVATESLEPVGIIHSSPEYIHELVEPTPPYMRPPSSQRTKYSDSPELEYINFTEPGIKPDQEYENLDSPRTELSPQTPKTPSKRPREIGELGEHEVILGLIRYPSLFSSGVPIQPF